MELPDSEVWAAWRCGGVSWQLYGNMLTYANFCNNAMDLVMGYEVNRTLMAQIRRDADEEAGEHAHGMVAHRAGNPPANVNMAVRNSLAPAPNL
jgi:hypothetical protein